ncbi:hypothetical protein I9W82_000267 [Candida metapsilosis]|uniref:Mtf2-like C-terminal domain-containing protein n=1 Tax=Candida metapsilosis TaxID=273372 RepID=A0A8H8DDA5_9ASCO|nr:hypothetical protein I9W82_000267 [Candida metapsilosis]
MRLPSRVPFCVECLRPYPWRGRLPNQARFQHSSINLQGEIKEGSESGEIKQGSESGEIKQGSESGEKPRNTEYTPDSAGAVKEKSESLSKDSNEPLTQDTNSMGNHSDSAINKPISETSDSEGVLQSMTHNNLFTNSNKIDFQRLSQFIKEAYDQRPHEKAPKEKEDPLNINALLSNYKRDNQNVRFLKEAAPSFQSRITVQSLDLELREKLYERCEAALIPTLTIIDNLQSSLEVYQFYTKILNRVVAEIKNAKKDHTLNDGFYLRNVFLETNSGEWDELHDGVIEKVRAASASDAVNFECNILTLPIITNHVFKKLAFRMYNGSLVITLFNKLKEDVHLYTSCCNQQTYNEVLRTIWVYNGNIDLSEFEKVYTEMKFLGYNGDFVTYNILKTVIDEYNALSSGNSVFNRYGSKILTRDDNSRVAFLTKEFHKLQKRLSNQLVKQDNDERSFQL